MSEQPVQARWQEQRQKLSNVAAVVQSNLDSKHPGKFRVFVRGDAVRVLRVPDPR
jgi:hypothetical protein